MQFMIHSKQVHLTLIFAQKCVAAVFEYSCSRIYRREITLALIKPLLIFRSYMYVQLYTFSLGFVIEIKVARN